MTQASLEHGFRARPWLLCGALAAMVAIADPIHGQARPDLAGLAWLAGSWAGTDGKDEHEEHWMAARGGAMVGMHRTVRAEKMVEYEFFRIQVHDGVLSYLSQPGGRTPATPFALKRLEGRRAVFENATHDFPQRIIYWMDGDALRARIEGTVNGKEQSLEWRWTKSALVP